MNISAAPAYTPAYQPQTGRLGMLHAGISFALVSLLIFCLSVYVTMAPPMVAGLVCIVCVALGGKRLLLPHVWPLLAILAYRTALDVFFPGPRPAFGLLLTHPLFDVDCVLLSALVLGGQSVRRHQLLLLGILAISLIGTVGDFLGNDMTAMLPFQMPEDDYFDKVTLLSGDVARLRGFFPESGVLGAVSLGFSSILGLGALVLIRLRIRLRFAWFGLLGAVTIGGAIFCLTVTKSGMIMVAAASLGFLAVLFSSRNPRCRAFAVIAFVLIAGAGLGFLFSPIGVAEYLRSEISMVIHPIPAVLASHSGMITRTRCWQLAFTSLRLYPLGVGQYGLGSVITQSGAAGFTAELRLMFSHDIFGLKNALANLIAQGGLPALGLLFYWLCVAFIQPIREFLNEGSETGVIIAGLYGASALACIAFLFSCELYPSFAFLIVLKLHADAVAQACVREPARGVESVELIG